MGFVLKSSGRTELIAAIRATASNCLKSAGIAKGAAVSLTKKETAIAEYLLRHSGRPVSSEELLAHAWDSNVDLFSNAVRVHIHTLRKKLGSKLGYDPIGNRVGEGYYLRKGTDLISD